MFTNIDITYKMNLTLKLALDLQSQIILYGSKIRYLRFNTTRTNVVCLYLVSGIIKAMKEIGAPK